MSDGAARADAVIERLLLAYGEVTSFLEYRSPFELLIAVILSAQTTDRQVNLVTAPLFERFPTPAALAKAGVAEIEEIIHSIGFFHTKARNIRETARLIDERFAGAVPDSMEELTSLPGVGRKSANVVRGTVFGLPAIIVDTHFGRVARRLGFTSEGDPAKIEAEVAQKVAPEQQMRLSMLLNKHGRVFCHARKPDCAGCPLRSLCPFPGA
jgi:endonuclease-3